MERARAGHELSIRSNAGEFVAYLASPASRQGQGVLVVHDHWGLGDFARSASDRLARAGFVVLAPDWLDAKLPTTRAAAEAGADSADVDAAEARLDAGIAELLNQDATDSGRIGVLGFGVGGALALRAATRSSRVGAAVSFYGEHPRVHPDVGALAVPVLAVFAGDAESMEAAKAMEEALGGGRARFRVQVEEGTRAGFMDDGLPDLHDATAADSGWRAATAFLAAELR